MRLALLLLLLAPVTEASYRVYKLRVTKYDNRGKALGRASVLSTLDHLQYEHYHGGFKNMRVELEDTWYCPGDTSRRELCKPLKGTPKRGVASTDPKRNGLPYYRQPVIP